MPQTGRLMQLARRVSSRRTLWLGGAAALFFLCASSALAVQYWHLSRLEEKWAEIEQKVAQVESIQEQVKKFRPWIDESFESLRILSKLTEAFPQEATVWAKSVEIRNLSEVYCSGFARNSQEWLKFYDRLGKTPGVYGLKVQQVQGETPLQFTFSFHWERGTSDES